MFSATFTSWTADSERTPGDGPITVYEPRRGFASLHLGELWRYRGLAGVLAWRDFQVRYKQSILGIAWGLLQPLATVAIIAFVMGHLLGLSSKVEGSYAVFVCAGIVPWNLFATSVAASANSLLANSVLLQKVYVPRLLVPLSALGAPMVDFGVAMLVVFGFMITTGTAITPSLLLLLPLIAFSIVLAAMSVGILLGVLTVWFRDFRLITPFLIQLWFFATPVIYPLAVSERWEMLMSINPMYGPILAMRSTIYGQPVQWLLWGISLASATFLTLIGVRLFAQMESKFADII